MKLSLFSPASRRTVPGTATCSTANSVRRLPGRFLSALLLAFVSAAACLSLPVHAEQADTTFNGNGRRIYGTGNLAFRAVAALPLPSGKVVSVFQFPTYSGFCDEPRCIALMRISATGGFDGIATFGNGLEEVTAAAVDSLGRIVVVAQTTTGANGRDIHVARFHSDSLLLDQSFGGGTGWTRVSYNSRDEYPASVAIDSQNRIVVAGSVSYSATDTDFLFVRLLESGALDTSFNGSGRRAVSFDLSGGAILDQANGVTIAANGDIVAVGTALDSAASRVRVAVVRLKPDGSYQTSFCPSGCQFNAGYSAIREGRTVYVFGAQTAHADEGLAIDAISTGGYVIAGATYADNGSNRRGALARFTDAGVYLSEAIGASLGDNGVYNAVKVANAAATRILVAGNSGPDNNFLLLQAFNANLQPLVGYGDCHPQNNGFCPIFAGNNSLADHGPDVGRSLAIDAQGRPLLQAQGVAQPGGLPAVMTARYTNTGGPAPGGPIFSNGFEN